MLRENYIDTVKGICILCIAMLHYVIGVIPSQLEVFIGSFMITSFYVVAGWLSAMKPYQLSGKQFVRKRFHQLGIPYIYWTIIILLFDVVLWIAGYYDSYYISKEIYKSIVLRGIGTLWFLPALFAGGVLWYYLQEKSARMKIITLIVVVVLQSLYFHYFNGEASMKMKIINAPIKAIYSMTQAFVGIMFGYYAYKMSANILKKRNTICCAGIVLFSLGYISANHYPFSWGAGWQFFAPLLGPIGLIYLSKSYLQRVKYFNYWGRNSLNLMVTHYSIILVLFKLLVENGLERPFNGWITLVAFLLSIPIQHILVFVVDKYAKFTLGKK